MKTLFSNLYIIGKVVIVALLLIAMNACTKESLDYNHPDVEVFVEQLKSDELYRKIPVIIISSRTQNDPKIKECQADGFISKSDLHQEYLLEKIKQLLKKND